MRKNIKTIAAFLIVILIGVWFLLRMPFSTAINQTIAAKAYVNGSAVQETTVHIDGIRSNYLFADEQNFNGQFYIEYYERTGRNGMKAGITWHKNQDMQFIIYYQNATFPSLEIDHDIVINRDMNEFALGFADGTIVATSDEMYQKYRIVE